MTSKTKAVSNIGVEASGTRESLATRMPLCWAHPTVRRAAGTPIPAALDGFSSQLDDGDRAVYQAAALALGCGARVREGCRRFLPRDSRIGQATKIDEDVPITNLLPSVGSTPVAAV